MIATKKKYEEKGGRENFLIDFNANFFLPGLSRKQAKKN